MTDQRQIHLIVPMSGYGRRYKDFGFQDPKPLIPINDIPMILRLLSCFPENWPCTCTLAEFHRDTPLASLLRSVRKDVQIVFVPGHEKGPSFSVKQALDQIDSQVPVLVSYCDYGMVWDPFQFERFVKETACDACLISYRGFHAHYLSDVLYAYSRLEGDRVVEVKEKGHFTKNRENEYASCGAYYFRSVQLLRESIDYQMLHQIQHKGEYYTSLTVQALLEMKKDSHVRVFEIPGFFQWGTPEDLKGFEYWEKTFQSFNKAVGEPCEVRQILMPMAGLGSRFQPLTNIPKPMLPIDGTPMFMKALKSLPQSKNTVLVTVDALKTQIDPLNLGPECRIITLPETPGGQALTTQQGLAALHSGEEVMVSSCDHGIVISQEKWRKFHQDPQCDAAIFTIQEYPGVDRSPESYAYVQVEKSKSPYPLVKGVSVKKPVSAKPRLDHLLVGTFWFKTVDILKEGIQLLLKAGTKVNNEYYLDSVFECLMKEGFAVRAIPLDGYICWGDPTSMAESLYWEEQLCAHRLSPRPRAPGLVGHD